MNVDQEISKLKQQLEEINTKKIQTATKLKALEDEKLVLLEQCKLLGISDPKKIDEEIASQEALIAKELEEIKIQLDGYYAIKS